MFFVLIGIAAKGRAREYVGMHACLQMVGVHTTCLQLRHLVAQEIKTYSSRSFRFRGGTPPALHMGHKSIPNIDSVLWYIFGATLASFMLLGLSRMREPGAILRGASSAPDGCCCGPACLGDAPVLRNGGGISCVPLASPQLRKRKIELPETWHATMLVCMLACRCWCAHYMSASKTFRCTRNQNIFVPLIQTSRGHPLAFHVGHKSIPNIDSVLWYIFLVPRWYPSCCWDVLACASPRRFYEALLPRRTGAAESRRAAETHQSLRNGGGISFVPLASPQLRRRKIALHETLHANMLVCMLSCRCWCAHYMSASETFRCTRNQNIFVPLI